MKSKFGFTLSELIVALTIVGVIASVTVPVVVSKYQQRIELTQLKKVYTNLEHNLTLLQTENYKGNLYTSRLQRTAKNYPDTGYIITKDGDLRGFFYDYYKVVKDCEDKPTTRTGTGQTACFAGSYRNAARNDYIQLPQRGYAVQVADGSSLYLIPPTYLNFFAITPRHSQSPATMYVDVNGPEKPNIEGRDFFRIDILKDYSMRVSPDVDF